MRVDLEIMNLSNEAILTGIKRVTSNERNIQVRFLAYLDEVDRRKIYAVEGYSSLFQFVVEYLGYSESSALKRIQVARKASSFPQIYYALKDGKASLTVLARLCPFLHNDNVDSLLAEVNGKTVKETENILVKHFPLEEVKDRVQQKVSPLNVDQVYIHFTADTQFAEDLEKAKSLLSHKYPDGKLSDILGEALGLLLQKVEKKKRVSPSKRSKELARNPDRADNRYISQEIRSEAWERDGGECAYRSPSGKKCGAKAFLEYDHVYPWALGGTSFSSENIRLLCRTHNRLMANQTFGWKFMEERVQAAQTGEKLL